MQQVIPSFALLLWWWGQTPAPTLQWVYAPTDFACAKPYVEDDPTSGCTPEEVEYVWEIRFPAQVPNTAYGFTPDPEGYRRQLGVPDALPPGTVMWWDDEGAP